MFFFYLWTAFYTPSWNGTPWVINSEMYSQSTRSLGQAFVAANNWLVSIHRSWLLAKLTNARFWNFLISRFTPQMFLKMDYGVYMFFACLMLLSIPFVFFLIPETKGIPLERMDELFETKPAHNAHGRMLLVLQETEVVQSAAREEKSYVADRTESV